MLETNHHASECARFVKTAKRTERRLEITIKALLEICIGTGIPAAGIASDALKTIQEIK